MVPGLFSGSAKGRELQATSRKKKLGKDNGQQQGQVQVTDPPKRAAVRSTSIQTDSEKQRQRHGRTRLSTSHVKKLLLDPMKCVATGVPTKRFLKDDRSERSVRRSKAFQGNLDAPGYLSSLEGDEARKEEKSSRSLSPHLGMKNVSHMPPSGLLMSRPAYSNPPTT